MKKTAKILLIIFCSILILLIGFLIYCLTLTVDVKLDDNKLINVEQTITYYYSNGEKIKEEASGVEVVDYSQIPKHVINAFISIEDKRFYNHHGVDVKGLIRATVNNLKSFSLKEGASTISQQLIKNTHLSNVKTLKRKVLEIKLSLELEKKYSKDKIMEMYLNTIYFGEGCYGISNASKHYFNKETKDLTIVEGATLAGIIKAPSTYSLSRNNEKCNARKNIVLYEMFNNDYVTHNDFENGKKTTITSKEKTTKVPYFELIKKETNKLIDDTLLYDKNISVFTSISPTIQSILTQKVFQDNTNFSSIILNKNNEIIAYNSSVPEQYRQVGSTIKPLAVYAPAIEKNIVYSLSKILDSKENFNGYSPSNFNDKYYGYVSVKESLEKSLNTCSVKLLNKLGVDNSLYYLNKTFIPITENDKSLVLALGATEKGATLTEIASSYNLFQNNGELNNVSVVNSIKFGDKIIYKKNNNKNKVFSEDTVSIVNDMLYSVSQKGTGKKLSALPFPVYSKTGTVGNDYGNTDAYSISYNSDYIVGVWIGNLNGKYLSNEVTGGGLPTTQAFNIWEKIYENDAPPNKINSSDQIIELEIDKISYDNDNIIKIADKNAPKRYKIKGLFKKSFIPNQISQRFSTPYVLEEKICFDKNEINIKFKLEKYFNILIYKTYNNKKELIFDSENNISTNCFIDKNITPNTEYSYSLIPYFKNNNNIFFGKEIFLDKIKTPSNSFTEIDDDWWLKD